jgi:hypothetical protein
MYINAPNNRKSIVTFFRKNEPNINIDPPHKKSESTFFKDRNKHVMNKITKNKCESKTVIEFQYESTTPIPIGLEEEDKFQFISPPNATGEVEIRAIGCRREEKTLVRESGKTASTSSANYYSTDSSGRKFYSTNISLDMGESSGRSTWAKSGERKEGVGNLSYRPTEQNKSCFYK